MRRTPARLAVLSDFDGTIVNIDTCVLILNKFAEEDWRIYDEQFEKGEITLEECLRKQFSSVKASKKEILNEVEKATIVRPGFENLAEYCWKHQIPLMIISAGLDFVIEDILQRNCCRELVEICAPKAQPSANGVKLTYPKLRFESSVSFKDDSVKLYKSQGFKVVYIGDGFADYEAAKNSNVSFAIEDSKLAELLKKHRLSHVQMKNFQEVIDALSLETQK